MNDTDTLIRTKLRLPFIRPDLVSRPRLQVRLSEGLSRPLTLVTAPAGFGKTTLVASSIAACGMPVAWLSLDKEDNQVERFLKYLVAAVQEADHTLGNEAAQLLEAARQVLPEAVLTSLINDLDTAGREMVLVLDDYQFISSQAVHQAVTFLLTHCPRNFHLLIATRSDPPLPLARWQGHGQMVELRLAELRFTEPEAAQFLNEVMGLGLDAGSVAALAARTEGWIAGLQMAALSMRDRKDVREFIEGFSGTNRYILDYLLEEVLASQPPEIQHFLLYTSILERLTAPLCEAILANEEETERVGDDRTSQAGPDHGSDSLFASRSSSLLEYLDRANLFLVPLDDERIWYRYHHLFADLLRARLQQTSQPQDVTTLHTRAAQWYEQNGLAYEAIHHASLTSNTEWVERLIEQNYMEVFRRRETASIRYLTGKLSKELVYRRPWLCIYGAESHAWFGKLDEAEVLLNQAEMHIQTGDTSLDTQTLLGHLAYIKSRVTAMRGDIRRAIELSLIAREKTPASNLALLGGIGVMLGYGYFLEGDFENAIQTLSETIQSGVAARVTNSTMGAYCVLARLYAIQGQLQKSYALYQEAANFAREAGDQLLGIMGIVDIGLADLWYEWNDLEAALAHIKRGMEYIRFWSKADDIALAYTNLARIQQAQGNLAAAGETISKGTELMRTSGAFSEARNAVMITEVRRWLAQGNNLAVDRWSDALELEIGSGEPFRFENELAHITLARVYIASEKPGESIALLSLLEANAQSGGRKGRLIEILLLKALAHQKLGEREQALEILAGSLALAKPGGYVRIFIDEGNPVQLLLAQWLARSGSSPLRDYAIHLLSQFETSPNEVAKLQERSFSTGAPSAGLDQALVGPEVRPVEDMLVESLSPRELEVLHLIALGMTNQEIARQLIVAPGTVKAHTHGIYRKLDVTNRTEAAARARQLGFLP